MRRDRASILHIGVVMPPADIGDPRNRRSRTVESDRIEVGVYGGQREWYRDGVSSARGTVVCAFLLVSCFGTLRDLWNNRFVVYRFVEESEQLRGERGRSDQRRGPWLVVYDMHTYTESAKSTTACYLFVRGSPATVCSLHPLCSLSQNSPSKIKTRATWQINRLAALVSR